MTKILVIEDEQLVRENILDLLEAEGFDGVGAENGHVGVTWAWDCKPDLIICDVMMPELDGYDVLKLLRKEPATATIPFIFLTAKADKDDFRQGMQLGADDYLTKPFTSAELLGAISVRLERKAAITRQSEKKLEELRKSLTSKPKYTSTAVFDNEFAALKQSQFTGVLSIQAQGDVYWVFYLYLGRLLYGRGGEHPRRRWQRNISAYCPQIAGKDMFDSTDPLAEYQLLNLWSERQLINREQVAQVIRAIVQEVLFDSMQAKQLKYQVEPKESTSAVQLLLIDTEQATAAARQSWQIWQSAKFTDISPNQSPIIKRPEDLQQKISVAAYRQLTVLLNGQRSLRDLALQMKRQVVEVTSSLLPYIQTGVVELTDITDLPILTTSAPQPSNTTGHQSTQPLIACIDDSRTVCQTMEKILTQSGYQFIAIDDPLRALATLLSRKPDLIFLDLVMPNLNGYEICARLRKIPAFSDTPIIILTSNIIDRVRATVVGCSDYLSKPVKAESVLWAISKHLSCSTENRPEPSF